MNSEKRNVLQLLLGCANRTNAIGNGLLGSIKNNWRDIALIAIIILLFAAPASADTLVNIIYTEAKVLLQPILDALIMAVVPIVTAIGLAGVALGVVTGDSDTESAKKKAKTIITWAVYAELILVAFWIIVKIIAAIGGKSVTA